MDNIVVYCQVFCKFTFEGFHRWKEAPPEVGFLRNWHRHIFHVVAAKLVTELDRQIEFITLKNQMTAYVRKTYEGKQFELSCEQIGLDLMTMFDLDTCTVSEDDENGAILVASGVDENG